MGNLTYLWSFDKGVFTATGSVNEPTLVLSVNKGKDLDAVVSPVKVTVTNGDGCVASQDCYYTPQGMQCGIVPCTNPQDLSVINIQPAVCTPPTSLKVLKKY